MDVGNDAKLTLLMRNEDKRFSPENSRGPLYANLAPLRPLRVTSDDGSTVRTHWSGWINSIEPATNKYGARQANILATGAMQFLKPTETKIELQENQRSDRISALDLAAQGSASQTKLERPEILTLPPPQL